MLATANKWRDYMCRRLEELLAFHSAPALCGIKASNLINIKKEDMDNFIQEINLLNELHNPKTFFTFLKVSENNSLLLVYKRKVLEDFIFQEDNQKFLESIGYELSDDVFDYIYELKKRINENNTFPHEIGVFLGYDLNDTLEFIKGNRKPLLKGLWNVYSNTAEKQIVFDKYNRCKDCVVRLVNKGFSIENFMK